jgi:hypothetical protein
MEQLNILRHVVTRLPDFVAEKHDPCKGFAMGKYAKGVFPPSTSRSKGVLDLVHLDVYGPMYFESLKGYNYYVTFIDDYSRKT